MQLLVDLKDSNSGWKRINSLKKYAILDFETGRLRGKVSGHTAAINATNWYGNAQANFQTLNFYNLGLNIKDKDSIVYKYVYIDPRTLKAVRSNFDDIIISVFRCGNRNYFRVGDWIWDINSNKGKDFGDLHNWELVSLFIGDCPITWDNLVDGDNSYSVLIVECIDYNKEENVVNFKLGSAYCQSDDLKTLFQNRWVANKVSINLNNGYMDCQYSSYGTHIDAFNKNLIFGG